MPIIKIVLSGLLEMTDSAYVNKVTQISPELFADNNAILTIILTSMV
ncbi:MAG: hypothetical protein M3250_06455 [Thermoproteota archaeon]|nr:hypothetical protein [Thermoproteota archaeon]